jgi:hypothetical protein
MKYLLIITLSIFTTGLFAQGPTFTYQIKFKAFLLTASEDVSNAINEQINYSVGPSTINRKIGYRASLTEKFSFKILSESTLESGLKRIEYEYTGKILTENLVDLSTYKLILPINTSTVYTDAKRRCAAKGGEFYFYQKWSPSFNKCPLKKGIHYEEFSITELNQLNLNTNHLSDEFKVNGEFNLYFYYGSDFHSSRKFGYAEKSFKRTLKVLKKMNFIKVFNNDEKSQIFNQKGTIGKFQKLKGKLNGIPTNIYLLMGNPDNRTPKSRYEFFRFFKHAFKFASGISYIGHAGLGKNLNFDALEKLYDEKVEYNLAQKQMFILSACVTYLQSSGFFFSKKTDNNSLVLVTNGLPVKLRVNVNIPESFLSLLSKESFSNEKILDEVYEQFRNAGAERGYFPMTGVESN